MLALCIYAVYTDFNQMKGAITMKEKNLTPIYSYKSNGNVDTAKTFYFGSKATTRTTEGGNLILKVYNTDVLKIMTTGRVEVTHYLTDLLPFTLKAINHLLRLHPNNLMEQANKKDLTTQELFKYKKKVKKVKKDTKVKEVVFTVEKEKMLTPVEKTIVNNDLEALPF